MTTPAHALDKKVRGVHPHARNPHETGADTPKRNERDHDLSHTGSSMKTTGTVSQNKVLPELLAPAGSPEAFRVVIAAGADAVYLSGRQFGARRFAKNFSRDEIAEAIRYAHARGVQVYVTVNTLIHDRELAGVAGYLVWLYSVGVDAVLVQDLGIARLAREIVPALPLHASTQLTIHSTDGVLFAAEHGFSRVVLARELSEHTVRAIARAVQHTGIGLEVFVHGALCYSYSGQCLLSSVIGGRSGNRGMCAQPCRKKYRMVSSDVDDYGRPVDPRLLPMPDPYLLSPKDLSTYTHLADLVDLPVVSLKIEGRMRSPEYGALVTATYREALDAIARGDWRPDEAKVRDLLLAFNRGFTSGYLFGERYGNLMSRKDPGNQGLFLGTVTRWDHRTGRVTVSAGQQIALHAGDGVLFTDPRQKDAEWGFSLNNEPVRSGTQITFTVPRAVQPGARVTLTSSVAVSARARQIMSGTSAGLRHPVPVDLAVQVQPDGLIHMEGTIALPGKVLVRFSRIPDIRLVPAKTHPLTRDQLSAQLTKTGGTPFVVRAFSLPYDGTLFAPLGELNRMRRDFFVSAEEHLINAALPSPDDLLLVNDRLETVIGKLHEIPPRPTKITEQSPNLGIYVDRLDQVEPATRSGVDVIYFEPGYASGMNGCQPLDRPASVVAQVRTALARCRDSPVRLAWKFPRIVDEMSLLPYLAGLPALHNEGLEECMVGNVGTARAILARQPGMRISGSVGLNCFNHQTVNALESQQFSLVTLSPELSGAEIARLAQMTGGHVGMPELAVIVQGSCEAMISRDCLLEPLYHCRHPPGAPDESKRQFFGIQDETGHIFPFSIDNDCRTHIANAVETCLVDALPDLIEYGIGSVVIDARGRTAAYAGEMVQFYRQAVRVSCPKTHETLSELDRIKEQIRKISLGGITSGHYRKGLKEE